MNAQNPAPPGPNPKPNPGGQPAGAGPPNPQQDQQPKAEPVAGSEPAQDVIGGASADPLAGEGLGSGAAASRVYRSAGPSFTSQGSSTLISGGSIGAVNLFGQQGPRLLAGPVPEDELRTLRQVFQEPDGYGGLKEQLRSRRLLLLCGQPGTGRMYTALSLVDDLTRGKVSRLDPETDLDELEAEQIHEGHGYVLESSTAGLPGEAGLDRWCALLGDRKAYAVLLAVPEVGDLYSQGGRYHRLHTPAAAADVLEKHLANELEDVPPPAQSTARSAATAPDVTAALGIGELRPREAARFAVLVAKYARGSRTHAELLDECREFAKAQAAEWFVGGPRSETPQRLRDAAYRIAVAVLGGASLSAVAEAAEILAWELAVTVAPESTPGRPLFSDGVDARLVSARAVAELGVEQVGDEDVPVRTVRFRGESLAAAVLIHLWEHRHNVRGPVLRWLSGLCEDGRPQVWVRAAVAAGQLCRLDCSHTVQELVQPMGQADQLRRRVFAANVLDVAVASPEVGSATRALVGLWAREGEENLRWTAAAVLGRGRATVTVRDSLDLLGGIGVWEEGKLRTVASAQIAHFSGANCDSATFRRIRLWLSDERRPQQDLGLQSAIYLAGLSVVDLWNQHPDLEGYGDWPLMLALAAVRPELAPELAGLLWTALQTGRSYEAAVETLADWLRGCAGRVWAEPLERFLPLLVHGPDDRHRLLSLIKELSEDPDNPLDDQQVRRMWEAVQGAGTP
ncbi:hypothetical protein [Streptomyces sp. NPDC051554]|uniref:hypothetical protein n=1 Tax=Streptomyces sp. NPDC051554 TaxID=3365656 RepID=UPI003792907C